MNLRKMITRNITYSIVTVTYNDTFWNDKYYVYGKTNVKDELKKTLNRPIGPLDETPSITVEVVTEKRAIDINNFIKYSTQIN